MDEWPTGKGTWSMLKGSQAEAKNNYQSGNLLFQRFIELGFLDTWCHSNGGPREHISDPCITDPSGSSKMWS